MKIRVFNKKKSRILEGFSLDKARINMSFSF